MNYGARRLGRIEDFCKRGQKTRPSVELRNGRCVNFSNKLRHGEAVLLGMMMASQLSCEKKLLSLKDLMLIKKHYLNLNLPMQIKKFFKKIEINKIISFMKKDKKNLNEKINLIFIKKIGKTTRPNSFIVNNNELPIHLNFLSIFFIF